MPNYFPVFLDLTGRTILIVGGGPVAQEKIDSLKSTGAVITILAPSISAGIKAAADAGELRWLDKTFEPADVADFFMIVAATDDPVTNARVYQAGNSLNRLTNSVDDPENCNFIMSAIVRQGPMQVAVSSGGCSPTLAQRIRNRISTEMLTPEVGRLGEFLGRWRPAVKSALGTYKHRQGFWERVLSSHIPTLLNRDEVQAGEAMTHALRWAKEHPDCLLCGQHENGFSCAEEK